MARKTITYRVSDEGRDKGKVFLITEMGARPAHRWASRALFAVMNAGVDIDDGVLDAGFAGIAAVGLGALGKVPFEKAEPLMDELLLCVEFVDPTKPDIRRPLFENDLEEVKTIFLLQKEVFSMHVSPFMSGVKSTSGLTLESNPEA